MIRYAIIALLPLFSFSLTANPCDAIMEELKGPSDLYFVMNGERSKAASYIIGEKIETKTVSLSEQGALATTFFEAKLSELGMDLDIKVGLGTKSGSNKCWFFTTPSDGELPKSATQISKTPSGIKLGGPKNDSVYYHFMSTNAG